MKEALIAGGVPLAAVVVTILWKNALRLGVGNETYLVALEIVVAALIITVGVWANDTGHRTDEMRSIASITSFVLALIVLPIVGLISQKAYDPSGGFTIREAMVTNLLAFLFFVIAYMATHYTIGSP